MKKDFLIQSSYRFAFLLDWLSIFVMVATFYFIAKVFGQGVTPYLKECQGGYFPFVLVGLAFSGYFSTALHSFSRNIRREQIIGTLEAMLVTPTKSFTVITFMSLWNFIFTSIAAVIYLLFGAAFFKLDLSNMNLAGAIMVLIPTIISFSSIGIISASFIIVLKRGDPITWLVGTFSSFFGGVFFPIAVLPKGLQMVSHLLPITYSLRGLRGALLQGYGFKMLIFDISMLLAFSIILLPLSVWIFKYAVKKAKLTGSLTHY